MKDNEELREKKAKALTDIANRKSKEINKVFQSFCNEVLEELSK